MAITTKGSRFDGAKQNTPDIVGPGAYLAHEFKAENPNLAGFNSSKPKLADDDGQVKPAPGAYDPKLPGAYDSGLPRKEVPFNTGADRGGWKPKDQKPGPGAYEVIPKPSPALSSRTMGEPPLEIKPMFKSSSAPSIPQPHQAHGYEEVGGGRLMRQGPRDGSVRLTGRHGDSAGPGHYESQVVDYVKPRPLGGRMLTGEARVRHVKQLETPGPGHYLAKSSSGPAVASSFVSTVERGYKFDDAPGPGSYAVDPKRPKPLREQHADLQFFGSTTERFKNSGAARAPGPGSYAEPSRHLRISAKPFCVSSPRFKGKMKDTPGPGQYDSSQTGNPNSVSILGAMGGLAFGSMERRSMAGLKKDGPGPGAYLSDSEVDPGPRQKARAKNPHAVFKSTTAKDTVVKGLTKDGQKRPAPGAYDPVHTTKINPVVHLKGQNEGFLSSASRSGMVSAKKVPGPGRYEVAEATGGKRIGSFNRTISEGVPETGIAKGLGFISQDSRFKHDRANTNKVPGPGAYKTDPEWITRTHNITFVGAE